MRTSRGLMLGLTQLGAAATSALGVWQLGRAQTKLALQAQQQAAGQAAPLEEAALLRDPQGDWMQRQTLLRGQWMPEHQIWLDNRPHDRRAGTLLMTPLRLHSGALIWVQRGWQARAPGQHGVPPWPATPAGEVLVRGRLALQASQAYAMGPEGSGPLRQNLDLAASQICPGCPCHCPGCFGKPARTVRLCAAIGRSRRAAFTNTGAMPRNGLRWRP